MSNSRANQSARAPRQAGRQPLKTEPWDRALSAAKSSRAAPSSLRKCAREGTATGLVPRTPVRAQYNFLASIVSPGAEVSIVIMIMIRPHWAGLIGEFDGGRGKWIGDNFVHAQHRVRGLSTKSRMTIMGRSAGAGCLKQKNGIVHCLMFHS
jgi:hypothetical protein